MKPNIHPEYRTVVFHDTSIDEYFRIGSTIKTDRVIELDGELTHMLQLTFLLSRIRFIQVN